MRRTTNLARCALSIIPYVSPAVSQLTTFSSKRGLAYLGDTHESDDNLLYSANSSIDWYYNWSPNAVAGISLPFVPLLHGLDDAASSTVMDTLENLPSSSTHLLTFNEPDGTTSSGGSSISPSDAAKAYINDILPLRTADTRTWNISHPATTGSSSGLTWLQEFNASCWDLAPDTGCPTDFVALHWYGDFAGLASWLGTLHDFYVGNTSAGATSDDIKFWITEMALPQESEDSTVEMLNQSLTYLDGLDYVEGYAWYGVDRKGGSWDSYTGGNVAVFNGKGALTDVGALYLGGQEDGFKAGMTGEVGRVRVSVLAATVVMLSAMLNLL
ncbi:hypothetical protein N0V82_010071 [Gnomoniopsis sp. IMI 355080]|nr:hypothetical protein N0V82_010071 [Gnomoniopsis sp. IMI 355080]